MTKVAKGINIFLSFHIFFFFHFIVLFKIQNQFYFPFHVFQYSLLPCLDVPAFSARRPLHAFIFLTFTF